jgi:hypothetical protein
VALVIITPNGDNYYKTWVVLLVHTHCTFV